jgi:hypothetical protein
MGPFKVSYGGEELGVGLEFLFNQFRQILIEADFTV